MQAIRFCALLGMFVVAVNALADERIKFERGDGRLAIEIDGRPSASYVWEDREIRRPYFMNVHALSGIAVTRTQPPMDGVDATDHATMHPGIWLAFGELGGGDFWRNRGNVRHLKFTDEPSASGTVGTMAVRNQYELDDRIVCEELCRLTIHVLRGAWLLDWDSTFTGEREFSFGDQEEMGLGVRLATPLTVKSGGMIVNSEKLKNEAQVWGQPADWCDYRGTVAGKVAGVALLGHPRNFRRAWFHARDYGLLVANPFGRQAFTREDKSNIVVRPGESLRLRFGIVVHSGNLDLAAIYREWANARAADD